MRLVPAGDLVPPVTQRECLERDGTLQSPQLDPERLVAAEDGCLIAHACRRAQGSGAATTSAGCGGGGVSGASGMPSSEASAAR